MEHLILIFFHIVNEVGKSYNNKEEMKGGTVNIQNWIK